MVTIMSPATYHHLLRCPRPTHSSLTLLGDNLYCSDCKREFEVRRGSILDLVDPEMLDDQTARELAGNTFRYSMEHKLEVVLADRRNIWKSYYSRSRRGAIQCLSKYLDKIESDRIFSLGSGTGREIEYLLQFRKFDTVFCSDLSYTALQMVPYRLGPFELNLGLFTSDLNNCPINYRSIPIVIVNALHHTQDMHAAIERLLSKGYDHILFVEPTDNVIIRHLARRGLARRVEYSGVKPGRLELSGLRALSRRHRYKLRVTTRWCFPEDYFRKVVKRPGNLQNAFLGLLDLVSAFTNLVKLGNVSIVHLERCRL